MKRHKYHPPKMAQACIVLCMGLVATSTAFPDKLIDRGYEIPRTPRDDKSTEYYQAEIQFKLATAYGTLDQPVLRLAIKNTSSSAICLPQFSIPSLVGMENDIITVRNTETGMMLPFKGLEGKTDYAPERNLILPPGQLVAFTYGLYQRYNLMIGSSYEARYDMEAFYCDAFERGYPYADLLYKSEAQRTSGLPFFERSPRTTVKLKANFAFTLE